MRTREVGSLVKHNAQKPTCTLLIGCLTHPSLVRPSLRRESNPLSQFGRLVCNHYITEAESTLCTHRRGLSAPYRRYQRSDDFRLTGAMDRAERDKSTSPRQDSNPRPAGETRSWWSESNRRSLAYKASAWSNACYTSRL